MTAPVRRALAGSLVEALHLPQRAPRPMFDTYLHRWDLIPDGEPIITWSGRLLPVRRAGEPAMLKLALVQARCRHVR